MKKICYAALCNDEIANKRSSSGGIFYALAKQILEERGIVCGVAFQDDFLVKHIVIDSLSELKNLQGSKYVQSNMSETFKIVLNLIKEGKAVLFSGTPCQINGLYSFLSASHIEADEKLITIEIICHGVPSPGIFRDYIKNLQSNCEGQLTEYSFRTRDLNKNFVIKYTINDKKNNYVNALKDSFYSAFLKDLILRPSCYDCKFCGSDRQADITLGDFWGIEKTKVDNRLKKGCSIVICNSEVGKKQIGKIRTSLLIEQVDLEIALLKQPQIKNNKRLIKVPENREIVFKRWKERNPQDFFSYLQRVSIDRKKILFNSLPKGVINLIKKVKR